MKFFFLLFILFFFKISVFAQFFEKHIERSIVPYAPDLINIRVFPLSNEHFYISFYTDPYSSRKIYFIEISNEGEILSDNYIDTTYCRLWYNHIKKIDDQFMIFSRKSQDIQRPSYTIFDENLSFVDSVSFPLLNYTNLPPPNDTAKLIVFARMLGVNKVGNYIFTTNLLVSGFSLAFPMFYEVNPQTKDTVRTKIIPYYVKGYLGPNVCDFFQNEAGEYFFINTNTQTQLPDMPQYGYDANHILRLDNELNLIDSIDIGIMLSEWPQAIELVDNFVEKSVKFLNDNRFIMSYSARHEVNITSINAIGLAVFDTDFNLLHKKHLFTDEDTGSFRNAFVRSLDFTNPDNIFVVGSTNISLQFASTVKGVNAVVVSIVDSTLELKSQYFYGYDGVSEYEVTDMIATEDGGCIITAGQSTYDENNNLTWQGIYVLKVNQYGTLTPIGTEEIPTENTMKQAIIYPNPVKDAFTIRYGQHLKDVKIELFNMNGQQVLDKNLRSNISKINIENLSSGTYIYHIISENKIIEKDKLIKE